MGNDPNNNPGGQNGEVLTFDEILEDKTYQSEFDRRVSKAIETAKGNWDNEHQNAKAAWETEAENAKNQAVKDATGVMEKELIKALTTTELVKRNARDVEVVMPLIDFDKVTRTEKGLEGLTEQLDSISEAKSYLFGVDEHRGSSGFEHGGSKLTDEEKIKKTMGLPI